MIPPSWVVAPWLTCVDKMTPHHTQTQTNTAPDTGTAPNTVFSKTMSPDTQTPEHPNTGCGLGGGGSPPRTKQQQKQTKQTKQAKQTNKTKQTKQTTQTNTNKTYAMVRKWPSPRVQQGRAPAAWPAAVESKWDRD